MIPIRKINPLEKSSMERKKIQELQNKIIGQGNNIALAKGVVPDPNKRQFIKKGILGIIAGIGIAIFSKIVHAGGIKFYDESTAFGDISARVYHSVDQSIVNVGAGTAVAFDSEYYDTDSIHDNSTNNSRLTCKTAGKYLVVGNAAFDANVTGRRSMWIDKNGMGVTRTVFTQWDTAQDYRSYMIVTVLLDLAVNDYIELGVYQSSGDALDIKAGDQGPQFMMVKVP